MAHMHKLSSGRPWADSAINLRASWVHTRYGLRLRWTAVRPTEQRAATPTAPERLGRLSLGQTTHVRCHRLGGCLNPRAATASTISR